MLKNEYFVFAGTLITMTGKPTQSIIIGLKGNNKSSVTKKTTRLVTDHFPIDLIKDYHPLQKLLEAVQSGQKTKNNI